ncbi:MAG: aminotransferase class V-fold PLP-dependent enzyme [Deltaproteobacteria bacterium]|nr:aminotransferase class V-fold PLP-dependent enzyme [Candidatus Anaeroferrophillus wilburensis]MBN2890141.1 aminotransferase class V-fold PLP-dependent enzyme [Deltaproteobacteria bacterium]
MIYLDNGATSFPKPPAVMEAMTRYATAVGASPGRSGHRLAADAGRLVFQARELAASLLKAPDSSRIIFTKNATEALNLAILGLARSGSRILTTTIEHNSVIRPLRYLEQQGQIILDLIPVNPEGEVSFEVLQQLLNKHTYQLAIINHGSNVTGSISPLQEIIPLFRKQEITVIVDGAQTAGAIPIDMDDLDIDIFCFTGHKSLLGPQGTGGLYLKSGINPLPLIRGGTGSRSEAEYQPEFLPDYYESGTPNTIGLAGLAAGLDFVNKSTVAAIHRHEYALTRHLCEELKNIPGLTLHGPPVGKDRLPVISFTIDHLAPSEIGFHLDRQYDMMVRVGLHCAPLAHKTIGTFPRGTVRLTPGYFNTMEEMEKTARAIRQIAGSSR